MMNGFSNFLVDDWRKNRIASKNRWKDGQTVSFERRNYMDGETNDHSESGASGYRENLWRSSGSSIDNELPELVVFIQETNYEFMQDICNDKLIATTTTTSHGNIFEGDCELKNGYFTIPSLLKCSTMDIDSESTEESEDLMSSISSAESTQTLEKDFCSEVIEQEEIHPDATDELSSRLSKSKLVLEMLLDREEKQTEQYKSHSFDFGFGLDYDYEHRQREASLNLVAIPSSLSPYSDSVSLRSNSSTNSSHSFAFPILQTEWNGSPERMIKANPIQTQRRRLWRMLFPCCKF